MRAKATSSTSLSLTWGEIPRDSLHGILRGYKILFRVVGKDIIKTRTTIPIQHQLSLNGLLKYTAYVVRIIGFTIGDGISSGEVFVTTDQDSE